jgi:threonine dehydrogenase-like Zn-dependent dehydrogenase
LQIAVNLFVTRDLHIEGILGYTTESWRRTLDWLTSGKLRLGDLITHRRTINQFDQALALVESRSEPIGKVAVNFV